MKQLSSFPPHCYLENGKKRIRTADLFDYYTRDVYKDALHDFAELTLFFIKTQMNNWYRCPRYLGDSGEYMEFKYYDNLQPIKYGTLMTTSALIYEMVTLQETLREHIEQSKFLFSGTSYYFMPVNIWLQNYMYDPETFEIRMVDVDSFEVAEEDAIDDIFRLHYNGYDFILRDRYK